VAASQAAPPPASSGPPADPGWARGAGVYGIVAGVGTIALTAASEATKEDQIPALPLGVGATVLIAVSGPVTAVGAASARQGGDVKGAQGARIAGWIGYGLTLLDASILIGMGVSEVEPVDGLILSVGLLGAASLACFSTDAFISASQAETAAGTSGTRARGFDFSMSPALGVRRTEQGTFEPTVGLQGVF
jgi:hypothetical protein